MRHPVVGLKADADAELLLPDPEDAARGSFRNLAATGDHHRTAAHHFAKPTFGVRFKAGIFRRGPLCFPGREPCLIGGDDFRGGIHFRLFGASELLPAEVHIDGTCRGSVPDDGEVPRVPHVGHNPNRAGFQAKHPTVMLRHIRSDQRGLLVIGVASNQSVDRHGGLLCAGVAPGTPTSRTTGPFYGRKSSVVPESLTVRNQRRWGFIALKLVVKFGLATRGSFGPTFSKSPVSGFWTR